MRTGFAKKDGSAKKGRPTLGGPELHMPSFEKLSLKGRKLPFQAKKPGAGVKLPGPVAGVVADLRERGLLPVVLVLVVAIVAVPLLLADGKPAPKPHASGLPAAAAFPAGPHAVVLADQGGVRDYRKRLSGAAKDPFEQQFQAPAAGAAGGDTGVVSVAGSGGSASASGGSVGASASGGSTSTGGSGSTSSGGNTAGSGSGHFYVTYSIDLYVGEAGKKLKRRTDVTGTTVLPNKNVQVAAFIGVPIDDPGAGLFMVSDAVALLSGEGKCELGEHGCQLLSLKPGETAKFHYADGRVYAIKMTAINPLVRKKLPDQKPK
jgi:hypothetical protein